MNKSTPTSRAAPIGEALEALDMPAAAGEGLVEEVRGDQENLSSFLTVR